MNRGIAIRLDETNMNNRLSGLISQSLFAIDNATSSDEDIDYKPLYYFLYNGISDVLEALNDRRNDNTGNHDLQDEITGSLKKLQCDAEGLFLEQSEQISDNHSEDRELTIVRTTSN